MTLLAQHTIRLTQTPGRCRWCGCTDDHACAGGCSWANGDGTLCSACVPLDQAVRTRQGRIELAEFLQEQWEQEHIRAVLGQIWPGHRCLVLDRGMRLRVVDRSQLL